MAMAGLPAPGIRQTGFYTIIFKRTVKEVGERGAEDFTLKKGVDAGKSSVEKLGEKGRESMEKIRRKLFRL